ncbi:MAG: hypothetical protein PHP71_06005 [Methanosarcina sp.]|nr:hypothetical protein [Methanosarcina sp.]
MRLAEIEAPELRPEFRCPSSASEARRPFRQSCVSAVRCPFRSAALRSRGLIFGGDS